MTEGDLQIRSSLCGHPDPFRFVRDLGRVRGRCSCEAGERESRSSVWLPAWLPRTGARDLTGTLAVVWLE